MGSNNNNFLFIRQITFKDTICVSGKYDIKFFISTFVADKNEFCNKFAGVATAKDFVSKFHASRTDAGPSTQCARPTTVDVSGDAEMSEEDDSLVRANGLKTPKKNKNTTRKRKQGTQQPEGAELQSPDKVSRKANPIDEEIEAHYIGKLLYFTALFECTLFYANLDGHANIEHTRRAPCEKRAKANTGGDNSNKRCLSNTRSQLKSSRRFGSSSRILGIHYRMFRFFSAMSRNYRVFPGKISKCPDSRRNLQIPGTILALSRNSVC